ncbi:hypothetical protein [Amycolatopsis cihanbeyliensis]|uniref:Uncharacterized protein n=1 Tax=Amycolatopsis cihanbeyliensis TaxID=1128664 RepID=A0A542DKI8_AMYCI|nr:hypothetical protein [Amycolatopsis cihanbeyliensis]TQJ03599.1 hypothetical protein FB471_3361 [Amycolatopsis cihanbeyliensis]
MRGLVLICGQHAPELPEADDVRTERLPARPGKAAVDPLLVGEEAGHLMVAGTDADLAAVLLRLLRKEKIATTKVGYIPAEPRSAVAGLWGLPTDPLRALALAWGGEVDPVPLIRDDSGGVLAGRGVIGPVRGVGYCDDQRALRGGARRIEVEPDVEAGLVARITRGTLLRRSSTFAGRAFELGCLPTTPILDGVPFSRTVNRWTWYRHTEDLRLIRTG